MFWFAIKEAIQRSMEIIETLRRSWFQRMYFISKVQSNLHKYCFIVVLAI